MDRASSKHGPRLDDEMERETRGLVHGSLAGGRMAEWREPEPSGEDEPGVSFRPHTDLTSAGGGVLNISDAERERRSRLGVYLRSSIFPADRDTVVAEARSTRAPDDVVTELTRLPARRDYRNVAAVWSALGYPTDERF